MLKMIRLNVLQDNKTFEQHVEIPPPPSIPAEYDLEDDSLECWVSLQLEHISKLRGNVQDRIQKLMSSDVGRIAALEEIKSVIDSETMLLSEISQYVSDLIADIKDEEGQDESQQQQINHNCFAASGFEDRK